MLPVAKQFYQGDLDNSSLQQYEGKQTWEAFDWIHTYKGQFSNDNLHGFGTYKWINYENYTYEGTFYGGDLDGYGIMSYQNNSVFEGLFKDNSRFGPGVFTYSTGKQDVGLWDGKKIIRLCGILGCITIPQLVRNQSGQNKLILFRELVPLQEDDDIAKYILCQMNCNEALLSKSDLLYFQSSRHHESIFFNKNKYKNFFENNEDIYIYADHSVSSLEGTSNENTPLPKNSKEIENNYLDVTNSGSELHKTRQLKVTHIISWNNSSISIGILQHLLFHRKFENILSYNITNILKGDRTIFGEPGHYENMCVMWLQLCCNGKEMISYDFMTRNNIHPDVCDCRGNSGIIYASVNDNLNMIQALAKIGANFDYVNDEGLTALTMSLLRYIAVAENISNWEFAFLPPNLNGDCTGKVKTEWFTYYTKPNIFYKPKIDISNLTVETQNIYYSSSFQETSQRSDNINSDKKKSSLDENSNDLSMSLNDCSQIYIFNMDHSTIEKNVKDKKNNKEKKNIEKVDVESKATEKNQELDSLVDNQLIVISNTINILLQKGSCPNYGRVPFPPLILSIFTWNLNIVEEMLIFKANPNIRTLKEQGSLTPLHILVSLKPSEVLIEILNVLLKYGADVHLRTEPTHQDFIKLPPACSQQNDLGKTPLHMLCLRPDLEKDTLNIFGHICATLLSFQTESNLLYLGHTPLTLAIASGNIEIINSMLSTKRVDPNQYINEECGIPLTILVNERFAHILLFEKALEILKIIYSYGGNPLVMINCNENGIDFAKKLIDASNDKNQYLEKSTHLKNEDDKDEKIHTQKHLFEHLRIIANEILERRLKTNALKNIFEGIQNNISYNDLKDYTKFLKVDDVITIINYMFENGKIFKHEDVEKVFEYVIKDSSALIVQKDARVKNKKQISKNIEKEQINRDATTNTKINNFLQNLPDSFGRDSVCIASPLKLPFPEIDSDDEKYEVCFECCRKNALNLIKCPLCGFVQFCSDSCYQKNNARDTIHKCQALIEFPEDKSSRSSIKKMEMYLEKVEENNSYPNVSSLDKQFTNAIEKDEIFKDIIPKAIKKDYKQENTIETMKIPIGSKRKELVKKKLFDKNHKQNIKEHSKYNCLNRKQKTINKNEIENKHKNGVRKVGKYRNFIVQAYEKKVTGNFEAHENISEEILRNEILS